MTLLAVIVVVDLLLALAIAATALRTRRSAIRRRLQRRRSRRFERVPPRLMELLRSNDDEVLIETLVAAGMHAVDAAPALVPIVEIVRERTGRVQFVAAWAAVRILGESPGGLGLLQQDASAAVRTVVVRAALHAGRLDSSVVTPVMAGALRDPDATVRRAAAAGLRDLDPEPSLYPALVAAMEDPAAVVRLAAADAIGRGRSRLDPSAMCTLVESADGPARHVFLVALTQSGGTGDAFVSMAQNPSSPHRLAAIRLLGASRSREVRAALVHLLDESDRTVRAESAAAAAWIARTAYPDPIEPALTDRLLALVERHSSPAIVEPAIEALAHSGDERVPPALLARIPGSPQAIGERLVEAAALFGHLQRWRRAAGA